MYIKHAFPCDITRDSDGMTLRDYFAGQALISLIDYAKPLDGELIASSCYEIADETIKAREV